jgi:hypothetical protein
VPKGAKKGKAKPSEIPEIGDVNEIAPEDDEEAREPSSTCTSWTARKDVLYCYHRKGCDAFVGLG